MPLTLGGDHSVSIGTIHGVSEVHNDLAVLYVDAHGDINTPHMSQSGNIHGMVMAFLIKEMQPYLAKIPAFSWITPRYRRLFRYYVHIYFLMQNQVLCVCPCLFTLEGFDTLFLQREFQTTYP